MIFAVGIRSCKYGSFHFLFNCFSSYEVSIQSIKFILLKGQRINLLIFSPTITDVKCQWNAHLEVHLICVHFRNTKFKHHIYSKIRLCISIYIYIIVKCRGVKITK